MRLTKLQRLAIVATILLVATSYFESVLAQPIVTSTDYHPPPPPDPTNKKTELQPTHVDNQEEIPPSSTHYEHFVQHDGDKEPPPPYDPDHPPPYDPDDDDNNNDDNFGGNHPKPTSQTLPHPPISSLNDTRPPESHISNSSPSITLILGAAFGIVLAAALAVGIFYIKHHTVSRRQERGKFVTRSPLSPKIHQMAGPEPSAPPPSLLYPPSPYMSSSPPLVRAPEFISDLVDSTFGLNAPDNAHFNHTLRTLHSATSSPSAPAPSAPSAKELGGVVETERTQSVLLGIEPLPPSNDEPPAYTPTAPPLYVLPEGGYSEWTTRRRGLPGPLMRG